jgi:hypothetical protein
MLKRLWVVAILLTALNTNAQTTDTTTRERKYSHQVGVQINQLINQIFNFNGTAVNTNPYLLTYTINNVKTGWGLRLGFGYDYQSVTVDDGITRKTTDLNDLHMRVGAEKAFMLSPKWSTGIGVDFVLNHNDDFTKSAVRSFDTVTTATTSQITSLGGGAMGWLRYHITKKILIGTECSFYYTKGQEDTKVAITRREFGSGGGQLITKTTTVDNERIDGTLTVPVAIFLIVKF